jgi:hypothetical protein
MKLIREEITVYPLLPAGEVHIVLAGIKIVLSKEEAERVARELDKAGAALEPVSKAAPASAPAFAKEATAKEVGETAIPGPVVRPTASSEGEVLLERLVRTVEPRPDGAARKDAPARAR